VKIPKIEKNKEQDNTRIILGNEKLDETDIIINPTYKENNLGSDRTIIVGTNTKNNKYNSNSRKLVGWLVSFTLDTNGTDFKLFEGRNTIGRKADNDIKIFQDNLISSHHATILHRAEKFYVKDEMSSNPTFKNGMEIFPGNSELLEDGDILKMGENEFLFKKI
jgi:pSer/pThr/pTyr-binding forkhead associated (FHA) protein